MFVAGFMPTALETKYRDIADGNAVGSDSIFTTACQLETKYRDIADGNAVGSIVPTS